jgi:hypothetical protein
MFSTENWELRTGWKRHTGVLEGTPSSKSVPRDAHGNRMPEAMPAMRYFKPNHSPLTIAAERDGPGRRPKLKISTTKDTKYHEGKQQIDVIVYTSSPLRLQVGRRDRPAETTKENNIQ